jgi:hypothetical protein
LSYGKERKEVKAKHSKKDEEGDQDELTAATWIALGFLKFFNFK